MRLFSVDAETNGLYGEAFAIAAVVRDDGNEIARFVGRATDSLVTNEWVRNNVLPALRDEPVSHPTSEALEESLWTFWQAHKANAIVVAHCASPVETGLFRRCVERDLPGREFAGPYPAIHDVATLLLALGEPPDSVDKYISRHGLVAPQGSPHHPMYDALSAATVWEHAISRLRTKKVSAFREICIGGGGQPGSGGTMIFDDEEIVVDVSVNDDGSYQLPRGVYADPIGRRERHVSC